MRPDSKKIMCRILVAFAFTLLPVLAAAAEPDADPIEPVNRAVFWFNDQVDIYVLEPTARGWHWAMPDRVEKCVGNFFGNLRFPIVTLNNILQGKLIDAGSDVGRFVVNTTVGVAGFFDPATDFGLAEHYEDFGQTLGTWGLPPGPYLVLPLIGPSNFRDGVGWIADSAAAVYPWFIPWYYSAPAQGVRTVNARAQVLHDVEQLKEASFDYYSAVRDGYVRYRKAQISDSAEMSEEEQEDLYRVEPE